ncbi:MAG: S41 family peptidase [Bacteroidia bacterium]|nr:S41 family peptidase [Bacteroidia bacterium]MCZ2277893.1 S41 family peptidase [Bacteroidia bacterium]
MKKLILKKILLLPLLIVLSLSSLAQSINAQKILSLLGMIQYAYVDTVNEKKLSEDAIRAILKDLDPHSTYIPAEEAKEANEPLLGKFEGVGIQFNILEDTIFVTNTISGGPSEKVGIMAGDRIVKIEGINAAGVKITNNDVMKKLRGDKGTKVTVSILRRGSPDLLDFIITRDKIPLFTVDAAYMADKKTAYIKLSRFADTTVDEFIAALNKLKRENPENLILDLTGNGGGYLNRAIELADEFLGERKRIVYTQGVNSPLQEYYSTPAGGWEKGKLVVMIDESSASASEIVSGAVQDWDRGLIVGRRSFGKGLVQKPFPFQDGSMVRLTVARYYTPSGRSIQKPYGENEEDYAAEIINRFKRGENIHADSIKFIDSLKYYTNARREVYGGGGIMPDVFVPADTTLFTTFYRDILRKGVINEFALTYVDNKRKSLHSKFPDIDAFKEQFVTDSSFMKSFFDFAEKREVTATQDEKEKSMAILTVQLKALVARDLWNTEAYFRIINDINPIYRKAVESFYDDSFKRMNIASN